MVLTRTFETVHEKFQKIQKHKTYKLEFSTFEFQPLDARFALGTI